MKILFTGICLSLSFVAINVEAQQFHRLESAVKLKSAQPDWDYITLDDRFSDFNIEEDRAHQV